MSKLLLRQQSWLMADRRRGICCLRNGPFVFAVGHDCWSSATECIVATPVLLLSWDFLTERRIMAPIRLNHITRKKRAAGNALQVRMSFTVFHLSYLTAFHRYGVQAATAQSLAAYSYPKDRPSNSFHYWHHLCAHWWFTHMGFIFGYRNDV